MLVVGRGYALQSHKSIVYDIDSMYSVKGLGDSVARVSKNYRDTRMTRAIFELLCSPRLTLLFHPLMVALIFTAAQSSLHVLDY